MKTLRVIGLVCGICLLAVPAVAQDIGVYFDQGATVTDMIFQRNTPFNVYISMNNINDVADAVDFQLILPAQLVVLSETYSGPFQAWSDAGPGAANGVQVGLGGCVAMLGGQNTPYIVLTISAMSPVDLSDETISLTGFPGRTGGDPGAADPRYNVCSSGTMVTMGVVPATFTVALGNDDSSWGAVKALYE